MSDGDWDSANKQYLMAALGQVRRALERRTGQAAEASDAPDDSDNLTALSESMSWPPTVLSLCRAFGLSPFERDVVLLAAGPELDPRFEALLASAQGDRRHAYPTFSVAFDALPDAHWSALASEAPLRRWRLVTIGQGAHLTVSPLRIDERILHYLTGIVHVDERLSGLVRPMAAPGDLVPAHRELANAIGATLLEAATIGSIPTVQVCGPRAESRRAVATAACTQIGLRPHLLSATALPTDAVDLVRFQQIWEREAMLESKALLIDYDELDEVDAAHDAALALWTQSRTTPLFIVGRERRPTRGQNVLTYDVPRLDSNEQKSMWQAVVGDHGAVVDARLDRIVTQFDMEPQGMAVAWQAARGQVVAGGGDPASADDVLADALWEVCRVQARPRFHGLAQAVETTAAWDDLVLPDEQRTILREIAIQVRLRRRVYDTWGMGRVSAAGRGISALFSGPSGTGKTLAAQVLANDLRLDLFRVDLSSIIDKYIGETEKRLQRVFDAAERSGAILLFDEADALFGKRSEVKDSHDRFANIQVSYLLQRIEAYHGLAILTSNLPESLDTAFLRRIRFIVQFPFPDAVQRAEIWRRVFPASAPTRNLDAERLAQVNVAGGTIRNIALHAAFLAADADEIITMSHILRAARREYQKLSRPLTEPEIEGWLTSERQAVPA